MRSTVYLRSDPVDSGNHGAGTGDIKGARLSKYYGNLSAILEAAGASTATVMKTTCFSEEYE